ncbi:phosphate-starvation-inducible protein PsiE [Sinimarinibacterium thermocellulolyticum]|uniref:Protein PsiE n=1 Tax=Sinimarinibacterium thermocellulolyticum TaxID=3170016 RepID=A0ABV2A7N4_9GAMM
MTAGGLGDRWGRRLARAFEDLGLAVVLLATVISAGQELWRMAAARTVTLAELLLLFIYVEVVAMVRLYWESGRLPVRMPLYIAMVAIARHVVVDVKPEHASAMFYFGLAVLALALAVLVVRYGHLRLPYPDTERATTRIPNE